MSGVLARLLTAKGRVSGEAREGNLAKNRYWRSDRLFVCAVGRSFEAQKFRGIIWRRSLGRAGDPGLDGGEGRQSVCEHRGEVDDSGSAGIFCVRLRGRPSADSSALAGSVHHERSYGFVVRMRFLSLVRCYQVA